MANSVGINPATAGSPVVIYAEDLSGSISMPASKIHNGAVGVDGGPITAANPFHVLRGNGKQTFSASFTGFTPVATPTDFFNMFGSASKTIRVTKIELWGMATAQSAALVIQAIKRSTAGTLGSAELTALTKVPHDSGNTAASGTPNTIATANYTTLGTIVGALKTGRLQMQAVGAPALQQIPLMFEFGTKEEQGIVLRGVAEQIALNFAGAAVPAGTVLDGTITWTEE